MRRCDSEPAAFYPDLAEAGDQLYRLPCCNQVRPASSHSFGRHTTFICVLVAAVLPLQRITKPAPRVFRLLCTGLHVMLPSPVNCTSGSVACWAAPEVSGPRHLFS